jgi:hypothetical protein
LTYHATAAINLGRRITDAYPRKLITTWLWCLTKKKRNEMIHIKLLLVAIVAMLLLNLGVGSTLAYAPSGPGATAPGQANAFQNCEDNINKQNVNGQTGPNTGSANDEKQNNTPVTNCDHVWERVGSNP